jgi:hypothetical protein
MGIHLGNHKASLFCGGFDNIDTHPKAHEPMIIRRRGLDEGHINRNKAPIEEIGNMGKKDWGIVCRPLIDGPSRIIGDEEGVMPEIGLQFLVGIRRYS